MLPEPILVEWELIYFGGVRLLMEIPETEVRHPPLVRGFDNCLPLRQRGGALSFRQLSLKNQKVI